MKIKQTAFLLILSLFIILLTLDLTASFAKGYQGYQKLSLPEGAIARLGKGSINEVRYSPDGNKLAVACRDGVWIYNAHSGQELALLSSGWSRSLAFSPDGRTLVTGGKHNQQSGGTDLHLWDTTTWQYKMPLTSSLKTFISNNGTTCIAFSPDGRTLASGSYSWGAGERGAVLLWDTATWQDIMTFPGQTYSVAFSSDSRTLAIAGESGVKIWNAANGRLKTSLGGASRFTDTSVAFSPDGRFLASGTDDLQIWDTFTWELKKTLASSQLGSFKIVVEFSPDSSTFAATAKVNQNQNQRMWKWDTTTWERIGVNNLQDNVVSITFSPNNTTHASADRNGTLEQWENGTFTYKTINHNSNSLRSPPFSPDGNRLATVAHSDLVLWDVTTGESTRFAGDYGQLNAVAFSPDGNTLASGGQNGKVMVWNTTTKLKTTFEDEAGHVIGAIAYSPDGGTLATVNWRGSIRLWDTATGKVKTALTDPKLQKILDTGGSIKTFDIQFLPDGHTLVSFHARTALLWDIATGKVKDEFSVSISGASYNVVQVGSSGSTIAATHSGIVELYDIATRARKTRLYLQPPAVRNIALSPDGSTLAISHGQVGLKLWNIASGGLIATLSPEDVGRVAFSPNGSILTSVYDNILLWEVPSLSEPLVQTIHFQHPPTYWISTETGTLHRLTGVRVENLVPSVNNATGLVLDMVGRKLYWTEKTGNTTGRIQRANLDGSNVQLVKELTSVPRGIAIDTANSKLYLTNSWGKVQRLNFDGSNFRGNLITGLNSPKYVALDIGGGKIYWTENPGSIRRANLNGSNVETFATNLGDTGGLAVAGGKVYWAEKTGERGTKINSANLNGSNIETLVTFSGVPRGIAVGIEENKLYWANSTGKIQYANLNGKNIQNIITNLSTPGQVVVATSSVYQTPVTVNQSSDVNGDGKVDQNDLLLVIKSLGQSDPTNSRLDVDGDGNVTIADLISVAEAFENASSAAAPMSGSPVISIDQGMLESLILTLQTERGGLLTYQKILAFLHSFLKVEPPNKTLLLSNYPNPFNPETWIPYSLASGTDVQILIYDTKGLIIRRLELGYRTAGYYMDKSRAGYWDGRNAQGELVASGTYFYTLMAGDFTITRKMLIRK